MLPDSKLYIKIMFCGYFYFMHKNTYELKNKESNIVEWMFKQCSPRKHLKILDKNLF